VLALHHQVWGLWLHILGSLMGVQGEIVILVGIGTDKLLYQKYNFIELEFDK
jgi:hypothetical protein